MSSCYVCTANGAPSPDPDAVACCTTCGVFACVWDGARLHGKGAYECAFCMVRVLIESAMPSGPPDGPDGGGIGAAASVRAFLSTEDFETQCEQLAALSREYRESWRELLLQQLPERTRAEFAVRLARLAGKPEAAKEVATQLATGTADVRLLADATGVAEVAHRLVATGPMTLPSVSEAAAAAADEELRRKVEQQQATPQRAETQYVKQQAKPAEKLKTMTMGSTRHE